MKFSLGACESGFGRDALFTVSQGIMAKAAATKSTGPVRAEKAVGR